MKLINLLRWLCVTVLIAVLAVPALVVAISGHTVVEVDGQSMEPTYSIGDVVTIREPKASDLVVGSVVTVMSDTGSRYTHRIVEVQDDGGVVLRGDNNEVDDPTAVDPTTIIGVVDGHLTGMWATLALQLQSWPLRVCVLIMIIGLVFLPIAVGSSVPSGRRSAAPASPVVASGGGAHSRRAAQPDRSPSIAAASSRGRRSAKVAVAPVADRSEVLDLVDSLRSAIAGVLLSSERRLGGHFTVTTQRGDGDFPSLRLVVDVTEKGDHTPAQPQPAPAAVPVPVAAPAPQWSNGHDPLLWTRPAGSVPMDLPSRRAQRAGTQRGRRRAR